MDPIKLFDDENQARIKSFGQDQFLRNLSHDWLEGSMERGYVYILIEENK
jgi:hypothetical protein